MGGFVSFAGGEDWGAGAGNGNMSAMFIRSTEVNSGSFGLVLMYLGRTIAEESSRIWKRMARLKGSFQPVETLLIRYSSGTISEDLLLFE